MTNKAVMGWIVAMAIVMGLDGRTWAATYHVDGAGASAGDENDGSEAGPWKTVQKAVDAAAPGDVILVRPGTYDELVTVRTSGEKDRLITVRAEPRRKARVKGFDIKADYIRVEGFEITSSAPGAVGVFAGEAHYKTARTGCQIVDNFIHDVDGKAIVSGEHALVKDNLMRHVGWGLFVNTGTLVENNEVDTLLVRTVEKDGQTKLRTTKYAFFAGNDITFRGNHFHGTPMKDMARMGVCFFGSWDAWIFGPSHRILIENNRCFNGTHASEPIAEVHKQSSHITFRNNLFVNTVYVGVLCKQWSHITVVNNTFINCGAYPVWFQKERECEGSVVRNNLIAYYKHQPVEGAPAAESGIANYAHPAATADIDHNLLWGCKNRGYGEHDITAEPQFVDPDAGDFRLKAGSPGIDQGTDVGLKTDLRGARRPQGKACDIGAYEHEKD